MKAMKTALWAVALVCLFAAPAAAMGPVDGEVGAVYWANNYDTGGLADLSSDGNTPGLRAEVWFLQRYGVRGSFFNTDYDDISVLDNESSYTSLDLMWRVFSPTDDNFIAVGAGWQEMDLNMVGMNGDTSGVRLSVEGRVSFGLFYAYGQGSYMPELDDASTPTTDLEDISGSDIEVGVAWKALPFMAVRAGYRLQNVEFTQVGFGDGDIDTDGFLAGISARF
ncbi:MAG: outer membrane beta-barrel protein [bacterium]|nr:outer membrane beta-barrel protein [bacterium]